MADTIIFRLPIATRGKRLSWDERYLTLVDFQKEHGHTNVPHYTDGYRTLSQWVGKQKRLKPEMSQDCIDRLDAIGFNWLKQAARHDQKWTEMLDKLKVYKKTHGDVKVPITYWDSDLARWVSYQRSRKKQGHLKQDREDRLKQVGFIWEIHGRIPTISS
jgi:hypothetical protein